VLRLPYVLGPNNYADREEFVLNRVLDDASILLPGDGRAVQQFVHVRQVGEAMANCVEQAGMGWRAYNIATPEMASLEGFVELCAEAVGKPARLHRLGLAVPENEPFNVADPVFPFPNQNYLLDCGSAHADGIAPAAMSLREMIEMALEALLADPTRRAWKRYPAETAALAEAGLA
jgi:nucleoside-diphosphate-sugar epimerase